MKRQSWVGKSWYASDVRSFQVVLTTDDLASMFNVTNDAILKRIARGNLKLSGDSVKDFYYLMEVLNE